VRPVQRAQAVKEDRDTHTDTQTDTQIDRETDRQIDRHTDRMGQTDADSLTASVLRYEIR
jgi:hypothetical protein